MTQGTDGHEKGLEEGGTALAHRWLNEGCAVGERGDPLAAAALALWARSSGGLGGRLLGRK